MPTEPVPSRTATATILFTDLVDSTAQRAQLGEEAAEALRRTHDRLLAEAVAAHRGTVAKHVGDGIMATFTGAADVVSAAVAIQQAVDGQNRRAGSAPLALRIGISLGNVTWEQGDCFGTPVIEAARLCAAAEGAADDLRFEVPAHGPTHQNLQRDPRVVCSVEEFPPYAEIKGVAVHGRAVPIDAGGADSHVAFRIEDVRVESFDFRKMRRA